MAIEIATIGQLLNLAEDVPLRNPRDKQKM